jgi:hypothetical protein
MNCRASSGVQSTLTVIFIVRFCLLTSARRLSGAVGLPSPNLLFFRSRFGRARRGTEKGA